MQPLGTSDQCRTTVTDKMARVQCQASLTQEFGIEIITADTRIDRILGKLRLDVDIQKRYGIRGDLKSVGGMSVRADCAPGIDPTTVRKF